MRAKPHLGIGGPNSRRTAPFCTTSRSADRPSLCRAARVVVGKLLLTERREVLVINNNRATVTPMGHVMNVKRNLFQKHTNHPVQLERVPTLKTNPSLSHLGTWALTSRLLTSAMEIFWGLISGSGRGIFVYFSFEYDASKIIFKFHTTTCNQPQKIHC